MRLVPALILGVPLVAQMSARAKMENFKSLMAWFGKENKGRQIGWD